MFEVSYDERAQAAYITVDKGDVAHTEELIEDLAWIDYADNGRILGIELIGIENQTHLIDVLSTIKMQMDDNADDLRGSRERLAGAID